MVTAKLRMPANPKIVPTKATMRMTLVSPRLNAPPIPTLALHMGQLVTKRRVTVKIAKAQQQ